MPLNLPHAPAASISSLQQVLPHLAAVPGVADHLPKAVQSLTMTREKPATPLLSTPVYVLGLDTIVGGGGLSTLHVSAWSHVLPATQGHVLAADTSAETSHVEGITEGPEADAFKQDLERLQATPTVAKGNFDLAELRVPALHVTAFWLKDKAGQNDILVPFTDHNAAVQSGRQYTVDQFLEALRPAAKTALEHTDPLKGG